MKSGWEVRTGVKFQQKLTASRLVRNELCYYYRCKSHWHPFVMKNYCKTKVWIQFMYGDIQKLHSQDEILFPKGKKFSSNVSSRVQVVKNCRNLIDIVSECPLSPMWAPSNFQVYHYSHKYRTKKWQSLTFSPWWLASGWGYEKLYQPKYR